MTDTLNLPIRVDVVQKQYKNGMQLSELARLYNVSEDTIQPLVADITPKKREKSRDFSNSPYDREQLAEQIGALHEDGVTFSGVLEQLNISSRLYYKIKKTYGASWPVPDGRRAPGPRKFSAKRAAKNKERNEQILELAKQGMTRKEISERVGVSFPTITKVLQDMGHRQKVVKQPKTTQPAIPKEAKEEPTMPDVTTASLESAVTAFKDEEVSEVIGKLDEHQKREKRIEKRVLNRDKAVWGDYLSARSEEIEDVTHNVEVLVENGKLIERTTIAYTLERELGK